MFVLFACVFFVVVLLLRVWLLLFWVEEAKTEQTKEIRNNQARHFHVLVQNLGLVIIVILNRIILVQSLLKQRSCDWIQSLSNYV